MMIQLCHRFENKTSPSAKISVSFKTKETNKLGRLPTDTAALWLHVRAGIHKAARRGKKAGQRLWQINVQPVVACQALCAPAKWNTESACVRVPQNPTACVGWWWWGVMWLSALCSFLHFLSGGWEGRHRGSFFQAAHSIEQACEHRRWCGVGGQVSPDFFCCW